MEKTMFKQIELPYKFDALEPHIDALTMETHYTKHHAAYTNNFNTALKSLPQFDQMLAEDILAKLDEIDDEALKNTVRNNGGGYWNHNLYFSIMAPKGTKEPQGELAEAINETFGSLDNLKEELAKLANTRFGSGWAWLSTDSEGKLYASSTPNQDNPLMEKKGHVPILGIDVWEHAYYLKYKNVRGDYVKAFWDVLDWSKVEELYEGAF